MGFFVVGEETQNLSFTIMSDDETFDWGIDDVATNPNEFFLDEIVKVDAELLEEVGTVVASIGRLSDLSAQVFPIPKLLLDKVADAEVMLKDHMLKVKLKGQLGMQHFSV